MYPAEAKRVSTPATAMQRDVLHGVQGPTTVASNCDCLFVQAGCSLNPDPGPSSALSASENKTAFFTSYISNPFNH